MWHKYFERRWYVLPVLSAGLLALSFFPFNYWAVGFVALVPLYYFVAAFPARPWRHIVWGGFIVEAAFSLWFSYFTILRFHWIPSTYIFMDAVHLLSVPLALLSGLLCGALFTFLYRYLRSDSALLNVLAGAAAYTLGELLLYAVWNNYYYFAQLGYVAVSVRPFMILAGVGGVFFISFLVALINCFIAEMLAAPEARRKLLSAGAALAVAVALLFFVNSHYASQRGAPIRSLSISILQGEAAGFGSMQGDAFSLPNLEPLLRGAAQTKPDILLYPFSPVEGAFYQGQKTDFNKNILVAPASSFGSWAADLVPTATTVVVWSTLYTGQNFYNDLQFWKSGQLSAEYRKQRPYPFLDYTPAWAERLGLYTTQIDETRGPQGQTLELNGVSAGGLICSEVHDQDLARADAKDMILFSAGTEAMFDSTVASNFSLDAARFRAAENNIPVVRANILGPSAIIGPDGSLIATLDAGRTGVLSGSVTLYAPRPTFFSQWGNLSIEIAVAAILLLAAAVRFKKREYKKD
ncbi:MAG: hypothetical protein KGH79_04450 [Patescibacteria group bacterium]|nr:hypothetical protein [Patescibacteria group bacterium]